MNDQLMTTTIIPVLVSVLSAIVSVIAFVVESRSHKKAEKVRKTSDGALTEIAANERITEPTPIPTVFNGKRTSAYLTKPFKATVSLSGKKRNRTKYAIHSYQQASISEQTICRIVDTINTENQKKYIVVINSDEHDMLMRYRFRDMDRLILEELRHIEKQVTTEQQPLIEKTVEVEVANSNKMEHITR